MKVPKLLLALSAVLAAVLTAASPAEAGFRLRVEDVGAGVGVVVTDGGANDLHPLSDVVMFSGSVGSFFLTIQVGTASPGVAFAGFWDAIDLNAVVSTTNAAGGTLRLILEKDGFTKAPDGTIAVEGRAGGVVNGPAGSSVTFQSWANAGNLMPTLGPDAGPPAVPLVSVPDLPPAGSTVAFPPPGVSFGPGAFSAPQSVSFTKSGAYSLFSSATITLTGPGSVSFDHTTGTNPAPGGLILLAAGVPCFVAGYYRRRQAAARA
jgi:hypothetical protein